MQRDKLSCCSALVFRGYTKHSVLVFYLLAFVTSITPLVQSEVVGPQPEKHGPLKQLGFTGRYDTDDLETSQVQQEAPVYPHDSTNSNSTPLCDTENANDKQVAHHHGTPETSDGVENSNASQHTVCVDPVKRQIDNFLARDNATHKHEYPTTEIGFPDSLKDIPQTPGLVGLSTSNKNKSNTQATNGSNDNEGAAANKQSDAEQLLEIRVPIKDGTSSVSAEVSLGNFPPNECSDQNGSLDSSENTTEIGGVPSPKSELQTRGPSLPEQTNVIQQHVQNVQYTGENQGKKVLDEGGALAPLSHGSSPTPLSGTTASVRCEVTASDTKALMLPGVEMPSKKADDRPGDTLAPSHEFADSSGFQQSEHGRAHHNLEEVRNDQGQEPIVKAKDKDLNDFSMEGAKNELTAKMKPESEMEKTDKSLAPLFFFISPKTCDRHISVVGSGAAGASESCDNRRPTAVLNSPKKDTPEEKKVKHTGKNIEATERETVGQPANFEKTIEAVPHEKKENSSTASPEKEGLAKLPRSVKIFVSPIRMPHDVSAARVSVSNPSDPCSPSWPDHRDIENALPPNDDDTDSSASSHFSSSAFDNRSPPVAGSPAFPPPADTVVRSPKEFSAEQSSFFIHPESGPDRLTPRLTHEQDVHDLGTATQYDSTVRTGVPSTWSLSPIRTSVDQLWDPIACVPESMRQILSTASLCLDFDDNPRRCAEMNRCEYAPTFIETGPATTFSVKRDNSPGRCIVSLSFMKQLANTYCKLEPRMTLIAIARDLNRYKTCTTLLHTNSGKEGQGLLLLATASQRMFRRYRLGSSVEACSCHIFSVSVKWAELSELFGTRFKDQ
eukprot:GHVT01032805.1.p1 GENE.GHVT01032805.1~~GHVT01032805.1.p1  ORF type:complete len:839 (-),score=80.43 GHVT01032805.1:1170-3686(-)